MRAARHLPRTGARGFAMVELMIVLGVIVVMMGTIAEPRIANDRAEKVVKVRTELGVLESALASHFLQQHAFPSTLTDAPFLGGALGVAATDDLLTDEWGGGTYRYAVVGSNPDVVAVWSVGPDGTDAGRASEPLVTTVQARTVCDPVVRAQLRLCAAVITRLNAAGNPGTGFTGLPAAIDAGQVRDVYGTALQRENSGLTVRSAGADRTFGTADDLTETAS